MLGLYNRILHIDVSKQTTTVEELSDETGRRVLGGAGLAAHILLNSAPQGMDPLGPENALIVAGGPATGSPVWGSCRHGIFAKSPQTGFFGESYSGGTTAEYLARTGFDAVVIRGKSPNPIWIEIHDKGVEFHSAEDLWGMETYAAEDRVRERIKTLRNVRSGVMVIGPAGENRVVFAVVENDYWRSAGRTGMGAVLGSKRVKALAFHGSAKKVFFDREALRAHAKSISEKGRTDAGVANYRRFGTAGLVDIMNHVGGFPTRYWRKGAADHRENINAAALLQRCDVSPHSCMKCFIGCGNMSRVKSGPYAGLKVEGPEYETVFAFGGLCEVGTIEELVFLNDLCDRLGLDTITAGNLTAFTIEAVHAGRVRYDIDYGRTEHIARLLQDIAYRRGIGETLARGIIHAADEWDLGEHAIHVKGLEPAGYDPRILKGMGLAYGTSRRGACHLRATFYKPELTNMIPPDQIEGKAALFTEWEDRLTLFDNLILCRFYRDLYPWEEPARIIRGLTGIDADVPTLRKSAAGTLDDIRRFNIREGLTARHDRLPPRFHTDPLPETGKVITEGQMDQLLAEYYEARGWDSQGRPKG